MTGLHKIFITLISIVSIAILYSCASIGNPSGGTRDEQPPRFIKSSPPQGATNVDPKRIVLEFDEFINLKDPFSKVVVSPTSASTPRVSSQGRRVIVQFQDTLEPNTTYTVDFSNSIEDLNEGNELPSFTYSFSTGSDIDSLQISGMVLNAQDLEPQQGMIVGVHINTDDSTFKTCRLIRVAKTDDYGRFTIRGLNNHQPYRVFALGDKNNDFRWDNPEEDMAFLSELIVPFSEKGVTTDSIWNMKRGTLDTVKERDLTVFLPNDILLTSYNINYKPQYLVKSERIDSTRLSLIFNAPSATPPKISIIGAPNMKNWAITEKNATNDTITYWLKSPALVKADTLYAEVSYTRTQLNTDPETVTDTLRFITQRPRLIKQNAGKKNKNKVEEPLVPKTPLLGVTVLSSTAHNIYNPILLEFATPLDTLFANSIHLERLTDSIWHTVPFEAPQKADSLATRRYRIDHNWEFGRQYRLTVDSIAAVGIYGLHNKGIIHSFKVIEEEKYANLYVRISGLPDSIPAFAELLNDKDLPVRICPIVNGEVAFTNLDPKTYYLRAVADFNGNGKFDPGDYEKKQQPDITYYYPKKIVLKANWDLDQAWNVNETPVNLQKPETLKKNKPTRSKRRGNTNSNIQEEEDDYFDPNVNPFDPNSKKKRQNNSTIVR